MFNYKKLAKVTNEEKDELAKQFYMEKASRNAAWMQYEGAESRLKQAREEHQHLQDRYDLLESLLKQLRVNVTLLVKKVAKET
jgi:hypothetical protein